MDLSLLEALEREKVLEVLQRDKMLRSVDDERVRKLKSELQEIHWPRGRSILRQYGERTCARCQQTLGRMWNCGAVCHGCSHRICSSCRVVTSTRAWRCTMCHAYRDVKIKSGEWFLEERVKKFPAEAGRYECIGEKLLKSYQRLSNICVVPPTPPPFSQDSALHNSKPFTKSVENLFVSFTSHIKKISKSQNDMSMEAALLTENYSMSPGRDRRSQSDTAINKSRVPKTPCLPDLFKKDNNCGPQTGEVDSDEDMSAGAEYAGKKRDSMSSSCSEFGHSAKVTGEIQLAVAYDFRASCLEITVGTCKNLETGDLKRSKCHPYVKIYLLPEKSPSRKLKTRIKKNTVNPVFNETLLYKIEHLQLAGRTLHISVWHSGTLKRKVFLGEVLVPLQKWNFGDESTSHPIWYQLCPKATSSEGDALERQTSDLLIKVNFSSPVQENRIQFQRDEIHFGVTDVSHLMVLVTGVKNLPPSKRGTLSTFVKGCLILPGNKDLLQKTNPSSQWSHKLAFSGVSKVDLREACLELELWEHASFGIGEHLLGGARLTGDLIWQRIRREPDTWHGFTLPLDSDSSFPKT